MKEEIDKLSQVIDSLREKASDPELEPYLISWLKDPSADSTEIVKLLNLRAAILVLNDERQGLLEMLEEETYGEEP